MNLAVTGFEQYFCQIVLNVMLTQHSVYTLNETRLIIKLHLT